MTVPTKFVVPSFGSAAKKDMKSLLDPQGKSEQELLDSYLALADDELAKAQKDVIDNPEYYRKLLYGGTQEGRPGANKVPWEHPIFKHGMYEKKYLESRMTNTTKAIAPVAITATGAALTSEETEAGSLTNFTTNLVKTAVKGTTPRAAEYILTEKEFANAQDHLETIEKLNNMSVDERLAFDDSMANKNNYTDVERITEAAKFQIEQMDKISAGWESNTLDTWEGLMAKAAGEEEEADLNWVTGGRDEWFAENKFAMDEHLRKWWEDNPDSLPVNKTQAFGMVNDYARDLAFLDKVYEGGHWTDFVTGLSIDVVTSVPSPQDLALTMMTLGGYKYVKTSQRGRRAAERYAELEGINKQVVRYGGAMLLNGTFALSYEEMRQAFKGIDLDNEEIVFAIGATMGLGIRGVGDSYHSLRKKIMGLSEEEQRELIQKTADRVRKDQELSQVKTTVKPKGTPKLTLSATNVTNPSPLLRLYSLGNKEIYKVINKIQRSINTLADDAGTVVVQQDKNAFEINRTKYQGAYNILMDDMEALAKQSGMNTDDFYRAVQLSYDKQADLYREKSMNTLVLQAKLDELDVIKAKAKEEKDYGTFASAALERNETAAALQEAKSQAVPRLVTKGNTLLDEAVVAYEDFYSTFNKEIYALSRRDMIKEQLVQSKRLLNNKPKDETKLDKWEAKRERLEQKHAEELVALEAHYKDRHLGYSPRYFDRETFRYNPSTRELIAQKAADKAGKSRGANSIKAKATKHMATLKASLVDAMNNSPQARALEKYDPKAYKAYIKSIPETVDNMITHISTADTHNQMRDISKGDVTRTGQGDATRGKSDISRRIDVDETKIRDYTQNDIASVAQAYMHDMGHKLSMREALGISNQAEFDTVYLGPIKEALVKDATLTKSQIDGIIKNLNTVVQTGLGTRNIRKENSTFNDYLRALTQSTNAIFSSGFGIATVPEAGPTTAAAGREVLKVLWPAMKQVARDYKKKGYDPDSMDALKGMGIGGSINNSLVESRLGDGTLHAFNESANLAQRWESGARKVSNVGYHVGGFHGVTSLFKYMAAGGFQAKVHRIGTDLAKGGSLGKGNTKYFARMGLTPEDIVTISKQPLLDKDGNPNYNMNGWDPKIREKTITSMQRAMDEAVIEPTAYDMPNFTSRGDVLSSLGNVLIQYSRFPTAAYNMLVRNGVTDRDAKHAASASISLGMAAAALYVQEEYAIATGTLREAESKYHRANQERNLENLFKDSWGRAGQSTLIPKGIDFVSAISGSENPTTGFSPELGKQFQGPSISILNKVHNVLIEKPGTEFNDLWELAPIVSRQPVTKPFVKELAD